MITCDLCGEGKRCSRKEIEGKEYDICSGCWRPIADKLKGKGRTIRQKETIFLPPLPKEPEKPEVKPPQEPPKIWGRLSHSQ